MPITVIPEAVPLRRGDEIDHVRLHTRPGLTGMAAIVVAGEDRALARELRRYLAEDGHGVTVAHDGHSALDRLRRTPADLLVLGLRLDGLDVLRALRAESGLPVLMVSARADEDEEVIGLGLGADDFLVTPCNPRVLTARVRSLLRRAAAPSLPRRALRVGPLTVDPDRYEVEVSGRAVECTRAEVAILAAMSARAERVFTRGELRNAIGGLEAHAAERTIDQHVVKLRRKLEADPRHPELLVTVYGVGYRLTAGR